MSHHPVSLRNRLSQTEYAVSNFGCCISKGSSNQIVLTDIWNIAFLLQQSRSNDVFVSDNTIGTNYMFHLLEFKV